MVYKNDSYSPEGTFDIWKGLLAGPPAAAAIGKTKTQLVEAMLVVFMLLFHRAMSFIITNQDLWVPGIIQKRIEHSQWMQKDHPIFSMSANLTQSKFFEE